jgi:hypothetical protein
MPGQLYPEPINFIKESGEEKIPRLQGIVSRIKKGVNQ